MLLRVTLSAKRALQALTLSQNKNRARFVPRAQRIRATVQILQQRASPARWVNLPFRGQHRVSLAHPALTRPYLALLPAVSVCLARTKKQPALQIVLCARLEQPRALKGQ
jgi:hypothetical protein